MHGMIADDARISERTTEAACRQPAIKLLGCMRGREWPGERIALACGCAEITRMPQRGADSIACVDRSRTGRAHRDDDATSGQVCQHSGNAPVRNWPTGCNTANQRALPTGCLAGIILSIRTIISSITVRYLIATTVQPRYLQQSAYTAFHRICHWRGRWVCPRAEWSCYSCTCLRRVMPGAKRLYIQNEGLSEIFW